MTGTDDRRALHVLLLALVADGSTEVCGAQAGADVPPVLDAEHLASCGPAEGAWSTHWGGVLLADGSFGRPEIIESVWCACDVPRGVFVFWCPTPLEFARAVIGAQRMVDAAHASADEQ